jgi:hypothetical protein
VFPQPRLQLQQISGSLKQSLDELLNKGFQQGDSSWLSMTVVIDPETNQEYFILQMHHCVYDGWCMDLYMRDFYQAYETKQLQGTCDFKPFIQFVQLQEQHLEGFWKEYLKETPQANCIYSGQEITPQNLSLDHFLPWSFVAHDQLWNIIPTPKNVNSAKSDWLPSIELYINDYVYTQFKVFEFYIKKENFKIIEDYSILFSQSSEFIKLIAFDDFKENLKKHILPQIQTARNMGFSYPFIYKK